MPKTIQIAASSTALIGLVALLATSQSQASTPSAVLDLFEGQSTTTPWIHKAQVGDGGFGGGNEGGGIGGDGPAEEGNRTAPTLGGLTAAPQETQAIAVEIVEAGNFCGQLPNAYLVDCLAKSLTETAKAMPRRGDYADSRKILLDAAKELDQIARNSRDRAKPQITVKSTGTKKPKRLARIKPVTPAAQSIANSQAVQALQRAETRLLRSTGSADKSIAYQRIAAAVGSNKVLLRSS